MARDPLWYTAAFAVFTPTGVTISSPQQTNVFNVWVYLNDVRVRFPPGVAGTCGFGLASGNDIYIPFPPSQPWVVGNDEVFDFHYGGEFQPPMTIFTANYGTQQHGIYFEFTYYPIAAWQGATQPNYTNVQLLSTELLNGTIDSSIPATDYAVLEASA